jgi:two-component system, OmpR family, sensor histidine kinase KdpD
VRIAIADRGKGLGTLDTARLFDRFFRGDDAVAGAGLGLAICKAIVEAHGGTIAARDRDGGGAEFSFTLPIASTITIDDEPDTEPAP